MTSASNLHTHLKAMIATLINILEASSSVDEAIVKFRETCDKVSAAQDKEMAEYTRGDCADLIRLVEVIKEVCNENR